MYGDVNFDTMVDYKDAALISDYVAGRIDLPDNDVKAVDANNDGVINGNDITAVQNNYTRKYKLTRHSKDILENWKMREDFNIQTVYEWNFYTTVTVPGVKPTSTVKITPKKLAEVTRCGMTSEIVLGEGCITFHTLRPPKEDVECMIEFFENGDGSAVFVVLPTEIEIEDTTAENLLDGLAVGSVRTFGSTAESSSADDEWFYRMGRYAFAEGYDTQSYGPYSHAAGYSSQAKGSCSFAEGKGTIATGKNQHVQGEYNIEDTENKYAHIVGNGTYNNPSNAYALDWKGNGTFAGKVTVGSAPTEDMDLVTKQYVDMAIAEAIAQLNH